MPLASPLPLVVALPFPLPLPSVAMSSPRDQPDASREDAWPARLTTRTMDDQHQGGGPGQLDLVVERRAGEVVDQHRQRGGRLHQVADRLGQELGRRATDPVVAEERGEEQRRGLAGGAGDRQHDAGRGCRAARSGSTMRSTTCVGVAPMPMAASRIFGGTALDRLLGGQQDRRQHQERRARRRRPARRSRRSATTTAA